MANYFAVGTGNWSGSSTVWATSSGGVAGTVTPTSADTCTFDANTLVHTITVAGTSGTPDNCLNLVMTSPSGTLVMGSTAVLNIAGSLTAATGMTFAPNASSVINFTSTSTGQTVTHAGYSYGNSTYNGVGGGWTFQDALLVAAGGSSTITLTNGALNTGGFAVGTIANGIDFSSSNSNTRSLTLGATTWHLANTGGAVWEISTSTGMTLSAGSSTINLEGTNGNQFHGGGLTYGTVNSLVTVGNTTVTGVNTFGTFACTSLTTGTFLFNAAQSFTTLTLSMAGTQKATTSGYSLAGNLTVSGTFTAAGSSLILRNFIYSSVVGTPITISAGTVVITNTDLRDITGSGTAAPWAISTTSSSTGNGDCGGNSGMTFQAPRNVYMKTAVSVNWSAGNWFTTSGGATPAVPPLPLCHDTNAVFDVNSVTAGSKIITADMPRISGFTFSGVANTPSLTLGITDEVYGSWVFGTNTFNFNSNNVTLMGRSGCTINQNAVTMASGSFTLNCGASTYTLAAGLTIGTSGGWQNTSGAFALGGFNLSIAGGTLGLTGGTISGTGTITATNVAQSGGTLTLGGILTLSSSTALSGGTLDMNGNNETGGTTLAVSSTGTLNLSGQYSCSSSITISGSATVANTGASGELLATGSSNITFQGGTSSPMKITSSSTGSIVVSSAGTLSMPVSSTINWSTGLFEVTGATAIFTTAGPITGTAKTLTIGAASMLFRQTLEGN